VNRKEMRAMCREYVSVIRELEKRMERDELSEIMRSARQNLLENQLSQEAGE